MTVKDLMKKIDPVQIIARAVYNDHERNQIEWILHYYGLFYNIINQQDYQSDYVILFRAVGERTPFADVFARTLDEYKTSKEKIDYSCSFMESKLFCNALVPKKMLEHYGKTYLASELLREYGWTCWEREKIFCPQRFLETVLKMLDNPTIYCLNHKYDVNDNLSDFDLDNCVMEYVNLTFQEEKETFKT